jgi:hypothetical protein
MKALLNLSAAALAVALLFLAFAPAAHAADIRKSRQPKDLSPAQKDSLFDAISETTQPFFNEEEKKRAEGKLWIDLRPDLVQYLPNYGPGGRVVVSVKLGGAEYDPKSKETTKGAATGKLKYLVFSYTAKNGRWVEYKKPRWQTQDLGVKGATKITADRKRRDEQEAALEAKKAAADAAKAAAARAAKTAQEAAAKPPAAAVPPTVPPSKAN